MKKSANEILSYLEQRISRLEKQAQSKTAKKYEVQSLKPGYKDMDFMTLSHKELSNKITQAQITKYSHINKMSSYIVLEGLDETIWILKGDLLHFLLAEKGIKKGR